MVRKDISARTSLKSYMERSLTTRQGGNDFEIFTHPRVKGHTVTSPEDTVAQLTELFFK